VANDSTPNFLFHNDKNGRFTEIAGLAGVAVAADGKPRAGMGTAFGDFSGIGRQGLVVTNHETEMHSLFLNLGGQLFSDVTIRSGVGPATRPYVGFGVVFFDFDNDTRLDIAIVNGNVMANVAQVRAGARLAQRKLLLRNTGERFVDVTKQAGPGFALEGVGRALAAGDVDNDGDLDLLVVNNGDRPSLLLNDGGNASNAVLVQVVGTTSNRAGIGTKLTLTAGGRRQTREVQSGPATSPRTIRGRTSAWAGRSARSVSRFAGRTARTKPSRICRRTIWWSSARERELSAVRRWRVEVVWLLLAVLAVPSTAAAQRDGFLAAWVEFYQTLPGAYGDEGPRLAAALEKMTAALAAWDREIRDGESQLQARLKGADANTALEVHAILAALYLDRSRFDDALREFDAAISIAPTRAAFHRYKGLIYLATARPAEAAEAFRSAWRIEPMDPQNAYRLIVYRSNSTTRQEADQALATFATVEADLIRLARPRATSPFRTTDAIDDDAGGALGFVPPPYARGFSLLQRGQYEEGLQALRAAVRADPLVADAASRSEPLTQGSAALRQGQVGTAIERFETAVAGAAGSSEAHRLLGTAYGVRGDIPLGVQHLRDAVRLNPRDERGMDRARADARRHRRAGGRGGGAARRHRRAARLRRPAVAAQVAEPRTDRRIRSRPARGADALVLFAGKGALLGQVAGMARGHLDYDRALQLEERRVALTPNNAAAHQALGRAYVEQGREEAGYAELVTALLLDPLDADTLTTLGQLHLAAGRTPQALAALQRALARDPANSQALNALGNA
jgi:tetratricopeptide (TPR) repeat protein